MIVLAWYAYSNVRSNPEWLKPYPSSYYEMLTAAIVSGQTYLKIAPDPRLKTLPNPWGGGSVRRGGIKIHTSLVWRER